MRRPSAPVPDGSGDLEVDPSESCPSPEASGPEGSGALRDRSARPDPVEGRRWSKRRWVRVAAFGISVAVLCAGASLYRKHQDDRIVAISVTRARHLIRADTARGYRDAADLLGVRAASIDAGAGSLRALALAVSSLDYRDDGAAAAVGTWLRDHRQHSSADGLLAAAAIALRDAHVGTAVEVLSDAGDTPGAHVLRARGALLAGNANAAAEETAAALAADARSPAALALRGDLLRRPGRAAEAREAYLAALAESRQELDAGSGPTPAPLAPHARATFGLAKLALSREIPVPEAIAPLTTLVGDASTPGVERAHAAMYLSALQARLGDRGGASATLAKAGLDGDLRMWLERASGQLEVAKGRYRVPDVVPPALVSASDDDPYEPPPPPPKVEPPARRPKLWGFKVHPVSQQKATTKVAKRPAAKPVKASRTEAKTSQKKKKRKLPAAPKA